MTIELSGLFYPNKIPYIYATAIAETIGVEAMKTVFKVAGIPDTFYPPPNNLAKEFDFAYFGRLGAALEEMYGLHGERGLALHAGRACFAGGLAEFGPMIGISDLAIKVIPIKAKVKIGLKGMAESYSKFSDQHTTVENASEYFIYTIHQCPVCWGRTSQRPICHAATGILEEGIMWASGGKKFLVEEVACHAVGDENCVFHISKEPLD